LRLAIFGGTFNPIHSAHITIARQAREQFSLDKVLFIPAANPPHKSGAKMAPYADRLRMVELACDGQQGLEASDLERGSGVSYSIVTIEKLRSTLRPQDELYFLIGADAFAEIRTWRRWEDVIASVTFLVVTRPGHSYAAPEGAKVERLECLALPVSSSAIRDQLAAGAAPKELPPAVLAYIREQHLYGT
jgi:nicotinate-nucleotide adenylyltransferase